MEESYRNRIVGRVVIVDGKIAHRNALTGAVTAVDEPFKSSHQETMFNLIDESVQDTISPGDSLVDGNFAITSQEGKSYFNCLRKRSGQPVLTVGIQLDNICLRSGCRTQCVIGVPHQCLKCRTMYCSEACQLEDRVRHLNSAYCQLIRTMLGNSEENDLFELHP